MSTQALPHSILRLLALTVLLSGLVVWGAADLSSASQDQHTLSADLQDGLVIGAAADDTTSDPNSDGLSRQHSPFRVPLCTGVANLDNRPFVDRFPRAPGLPRAPPALA